MSKTAPQTSKKIIIEKPVKVKENQLQKLYGKRYDGFYEQLEIIKKDKFKDDDEKFMEHVEKVGDDIEFEFSVYKKMAEQEKEEIKEMEHIEEVKGAPCERCGSKRTVDYEIQNRSLDEGATKKFFCERCYKQQK